MWIPGIEKGGVSCLLLEVELGKEPFPEGVDNCGKVVGTIGVDPFVKLTCEPSKDFEIGSKGWFDVGSLNLDGDGLASGPQPGQVDLGDRSAADGFRLDG